MTTSFNAHTQETGEGSLSSREGKRNRKAQALSALLSASALGVFLEGCGGGSGGDGGNGGNGGDGGDGGGNGGDGGGNGGDGGGNGGDGGGNGGDGGGNGGDGGGNGGDGGGNGGDGGGNGGDGGNGDSFTQRTSNGGVGRQTHYAEPGEHVTVVDTDTSGTGTVDDAQKNLILFVSPSAVAYTSSNQFTFTRSGDDLIIDTANLPAGLDPARIEIKNYFLRESAFTLAYDQVAGDQANNAELPVPNNVPTASALSASAAALSWSDASVTLVVGSEDGENMLGGEGNDILQGLGGSDTLQGEEGTDTLLGGTGADTYVFAEGDGADTIVEVVEEDIVNTLKFEGNYEASDFSFVRDSEDGTDLVITVDTDNDGQAENEVTLDGYFVSETSTDAAYSIEIQINDEEAFLPAIEG